ncbi:MAG: hypothetical protein M3449_09505 [Acidobacteriota bacterium]|nr:hypothetical protein [Acidobacteriota bacterium]
MKRLRVGGAFFVYALIRASWLPWRSISMAQVWQVQPPQRAWRKEVGRRTRGTGVPHSGQPPLALIFAWTRAE